MRPRSLALYAVLLLVLLEGPRLIELGGTLFAVRLAKGLLVAFNPVPVADLLAAAGTDIALVIHLGEVYGFRLSRREASKLLLTISAQLVALMGAYWGVNLVASALKTASAGLSTALTATKRLYPIENIT